MKKRIKIKIFNIDTSLVSMLKFLDTRTFDQCNLI